jgi:hypothetical protein
VVARADRLDVGDAHAPAVVRDGDGEDGAGVDDDAHVRCPGVDAVAHQLLDDVTETRDHGGGTKAALEMRRETP